MRARLGVSTCFAVKRWPQVSDWGPIVRDRLGLRLVQHSLDLVDPGATHARSVHAATASLGLHVQSTFTGLAAYSSNLLLHPAEPEREAAKAWLSWAIEWTAALGAAETGGHIGAFSVADWRDDGLRTARWADLKAALSDLAAVARTSGLDRLVIENLAAAREPSTMQMVLDLLTDGDIDHVPIRLCLDVGHMCAPGVGGDDRDPYAWIRAMAPVTSMVQLQQSDAEADHHWPFTPERNAIGRISADRFINALGESGIDHMDLYLEVIPPFEQPDKDVLDDLAESVDYWREALSRYGIAESD